MAEPLARRTYLIIKACDAGAGIFVALDAVAATALAHPEWDMHEVKSWEEWEAS